MVKRTTAASGGTRRNPPEHSRFKPGQSGNPSGRPRGSRNMKTLIEEELNEVLVISENGKRRRLTKRQVIVKALVNEAAKANPRAWAQLFALVGQSARDEETAFDGATAAMIAEFLARHLPGSGEREGPSS